MGLAGREVVRRLVAAIEAGDGRALGDLFAEDASLHHPLSGETRGRNAIVMSEQALFDAFSEIEIEVKEILTEGHRAAIELVIRATHTSDLELGEGNVLRATGRRIELPSTWWFDLGPDGLIVEERDYIDTATLASQLAVEFNPAP